MAGRKLVSVVIRTDGSEYLRECLASLGYQEYPPWDLELVVVSSDPTLSAAGVLESHMNFRDWYGVRVLTVQPNAGLSLMRNLAIKESRGEIIVFIDHDEIAPPHLIRTLVHTLTAFPEAAAVGGRYVGLLIGRDSLPFWCRMEQLGTWEPARMEGGIQKVPDLPGGNVAIRRTAFLAYGLFDPRIKGAGDDRAWFMKATKMGATFLYNPDAWVWHIRQLESLRGWRFLRSCIWYGWGLGRAARLSGEKLSVNYSLLSAARYLAHGLFRMCRFGFGNALAEVSKLIGYILARSCE